jgi:hypothetical protein
VIGNVERQTLGCQLPDLPGEEFRIALPELLSDAFQSILPWGFVSPAFDIRDNVARLEIELTGWGSNKGSGRLPRRPNQNSGDCHQPFETQMGNVPCFHLLRLLQDFVVS